MSGTYIRDGFERCTDCDEPLEDCRCSCLTCREWLHDCGCP